MEISTAGIEFIKNYEEFRSEAYDAGEGDGILTIGYGHRDATLQIGDTITETEALALLEQDLDRFESVVNSTITESLSQNQFDALVSLAFNVGVSAFANSDTARKINEGNIDEAFCEWSEFKKSNGIILDGLIARRNDEIQLYSDSDYSRDDNYEDRSALAGPPTDVVFVIDVSGSMVDDLDSVKQSATTIINNIFGDCNDARVGIITFNDTNSISTILQMTDQETTEARKSAAISGINSVSILGGGEEPANAAILSALRGGAGSLRLGTDVTRKVVVFTDEPAADPELRSEVISTANNLDVSLNSLEESAIGLTDSEQNFSSTGNMDARLLDIPSAQIYSVFIGSNSSGRTEFEALSNATGGTLVAAQNANDVVDSLIEAASSQVDFVGTQSSDEISANVNSNGIFSFGGNDLISALFGEDSIYSGSGSDTVFGNSEADLLYGNTDPDVLYGNQGSDSLYGGQGEDSIFGGQEADIIYGNKGGDLIYGNRLSDTILGGQGDDTIYGGMDADALYGNLGTDRLLGNNGTDTIVGGSGNDTLEGGLGGDIFVFYDSSGFDLIQDFDPASGDLLYILENINETGVSNSLSLLGRMTEGDDGSATIDLGASNYITLVGVSSISLNENSFIII